MNAAEIRQVVLDALLEIAPETDVSQIDDDADLRDQLDIDSMDQLNFVICIHEKTGVDVPERDYPKMASVAGCVRYLSARLPRAG